MKPVKSVKTVWREVYGKGKPYYFWKGKKTYIRPDGISKIQKFGASRQIKIVTGDLSVREGR